MEAEKKGNKALASVTNCERFKRRMTATECRRINIFATCIDRIMTQSS